MTEQYRPIRELLDRTRARWRLQRLLDGAARGAAAGAALLAIGLLLVPWTDRSPVGLVILAALTAALVVAALAWGLAPAGHRPSDRRLARFIEERDRALDDRLVTAVDLANRDQAQDLSPLATPMIADAARRAREIDLEIVLPGQALRRAGIRATAAIGLLLMIGIFALVPARQSVDAASLLLFPERLHLTVRPGAARVAAGTSLSIDAEIRGNRAPARV